jgi:protein gp37
MSSLLFWQQVGRAATGDGRRATGDGRHGNATRVVPLPNVWLGASVENQDWADIRIPTLLDKPTGVRCLSCEPPVGPVDLGEYLRCGDDGLGHTCRGCTVDYVVARGESRPATRPIHSQWVWTSRDQCCAAGVASLHKQ